MDDFCQNCGKKLRYVMFVGNGCDDNGFYCKDCKKFFASKLLIVEISFNKDVKFYFSDEQRLMRGYANVKKRDIKNFL